MIDKNITMTIEKNSPTYKYPKLALSNFKTKPLNSNMSIYFPGCIIVICILLLIYSFITV